MKEITHSLLRSSIEKWVQTRINPLGYSHVMSSSRNLTEHYYNLLSLLSWTSPLNSVTLLLGLSLSGFEQGPCSQQEPFRSDWAHYSRAIDEVDCDTLIPADT